MKASLFPIILVLIFSLTASGQDPTNDPLPEETNPELLGSYNISLNVKDLKVSIAFYEKLGFTPVDGLGSPDQHWVIISNGIAKIGLFQGFFPQNTITFNAVDARSIFNSVTESGIEPVVQIGMEKESGPCTFSVVDPDGNPILIDQH